MRVTVLVLSAVLLAGCFGGPVKDPGDSPGSTPPAVVEPAPTHFAVLIVDGTITGHGPDPDGVAACGAFLLNGEVDVVNQTLAGGQGRANGFQLGQTRLVVLDRTVIEDPRSSCRPPPYASAYSGDGEWAPTHDGGAQARLDIRLALDDGLQVGRSTLPPESAVRVAVSFESGDHDYSGNVTLTHAGMWPMSSFQDDASGFGGRHAVVWR